MTVKAIRALVAVGACALVFSTACFRKKEQPESEGKELSKNPIAAFGQIQEAVKKAEQAAKESQDMKPVEQAAYWQAQARKHEGRNRDLLKITGGKHGDDLQKLLDETDGMPDASAWINREEVWD